MVNTDKPISRKLASISGQSNSAIAVCKSLTNISSQAPAEVKLKVRESEYGVFIECQKCGLSYPIHVNSNQPVNWKISDYRSHLRHKHDIEDEVFLENSEREMTRIFERYGIVN